jgi:chaperonin GroES
MNLDNLKVIGDRVLIIPDQGASRTSTGLYLPPSVADKDSVNGGYIVAVGPGTPLPDPDSAGEPWQQSKSQPRFMPMEVECGDFALYLKKAAIEITYHDMRYMIVPLAGILVIERSPDPVDLNDLLGK